MVVPSLRDSGPLILLSPDLRPGLLNSVALRLGWFRVLLLFSKPAFFLGGRVARLHMVNFQTNFKSKSKIKTTPLRGWADEGVCPYVILMLRRLPRRWIASTFVMLPVRFGAGLHLLILGSGRSSGRFVGGRAACCRGGTFFPRPCLSHLTEKFGTGPACACLRWRFRRGRLFLLPGRRHLVWLGPVRR